MNNSDKMPLLFFWHGSPMNAIEKNEFTDGFAEAGKSIPAPTAILCISAHWETRGTFVTSMDYPNTIHDFGGFPRQLFEVQYPAKGSPGLAKEISSSVRSHSIEPDNKWGLDHGAWSVLKHLYPEADVPVVQLSLNYGISVESHFGLAKELSFLRKKGVLIIGSGNIVHNLGLISWEKLDQENFGYDWAIEANDQIKNSIIKGDYKSLISYKSLGRSVNLAIPTPEHFLPLLYILALKEENETINFFNDKAVGGSLTMTSLKIE